MLKPEEFIRTVDEKIRKRGFDYYRDGAITEVTREGDAISAVATGSSFYDVSFAVKGRKVSSPDCTCPYDWGPVCKHAVALAYHLQQEGFPKKSAAPKSGLSSFKTIIGGLSEAQLRAMLLDLAQRYPDVGNELKLYALAEQPPSPDDETFNQMVRNAVQRATESDYGGTAIHHGRLLDYLDGFFDPTQVTMRNYLAAVAIDRYVGPTFEMSYADEYNYNDAEELWNSAQRFLREHGGEFN